MDSCQMIQEMLERSAKIRRASSWVRAERLESVSDVEGAANSGAAGFTQGNFRVSRTVPVDTY